MGPPESPRAGSGRGPGGAEGRRPARHPHERTWGWGRRLAAFVRVRRSSSRASRVRVARRALVLGTGRAHREGRRGVSSRLAPAARPGHAARATLPVGVCGTPPHVSPSPPRRSPRTRAVRGTTARASRPCPAKVARSASGGRVRGSSSAICYMGRATAEFTFRSRVSRDLLLAPCRQCHVCKAVTLIPGARPQASSDPAPDRPIPYSSGTLGVFSSSGRLDQHGERGA